jgi:hypothetical protein
MSNNAAADAVSAAAAAMNCEVKTAPPRMATDAATAMAGRRSRLRARTQARFTARVAAPF